MGYKVGMYGYILEEHTAYCPYSKAWRELGLEDIGSLYCIQDEAMIRGYTSGIEFRRSKIFNDNKEGQRNDNN